MAKFIPDPNDYEYLKKKGFNNEQICAILRKFKLKDIKASKGLSYVKPKMNKYAILNYLKLVQKSKNYIDLVKLMVKCGINCGTTINVCRDLCEIGIGMDTLYAAVKKYPNSYTKLAVFAILNNDIRITEDTDLPESIDALDISHIYHDFHKYMRNYYDNKRRTASGDEPYYNIATPEAFITSMQSRYTP